ncbi:MAG: PQQ-binding-like beta-propeller repeat protein, partial [Gammaproteobacteria bacterium]|nr:PQQ-binding-like beta-propeller repeat protein [Gammaproteobacteria bacterium]
MSDRWRTRTLWCLACLSLGPAAPAAALFPPLELAWRFSAPGGFYSPPFVSGEQLFLGGLDGTVYALTTAGDLLWKHAVGGQLYGGAVADAERVYAASEQKVVVALDRATGDERWRRDLDGLVYAAPRLVGDNLLVGTGDTGTVYCFAAATGEERWRFPLGARMGSGMEGCRRDGLSAVVRQPSLRRRDRHRPVALAVRRRGRHRFPAVGRG